MTKPTVIPQDALTAIDKGKAIDAAKNKIIAEFDAMEAQLAEVRSVLAFALAMDECYAKDALLRALLDKDEDDDLAESRLAVMDAELVVKVNTQFAIMGTALAAVREALLEAPLKRQP